MGKAKSYGYDYRIVGGGIPIVVIGPDGMEDINLSDAFSVIWLERSGIKLGNSLRTNPENQCKAHFRNFCTFLNALVEKYGFIDKFGKSISERFCSSVQQCREIQDMFFNSFAILEADKNNNTSFWVYTSASNWRLMADVMSSKRLLTATLAEIGYFEGQDPSKVDPKWSRTKMLHPERPWRVGTDGQMRRDYDYRLRLVRARVSAPRAECPLISSLIQEGLRRVDAPHVYGVMCDFAAESGARWVSVSGITIFDVLVTAQASDQFPCPSG